MRYDVDADLYEGPLPLLVELSKLHLIDVFLIKLVDLTQQYLHQVKVAGLSAAPISHATRAAQVGVDLNELAEPLPLLGNLMAIKARSLLPAPPIEDDEEVPISLEELQRRLKEYEQFKTVAQLLAELHALQHQHFTRSPSDVPEGGEEGVVSEAPSEVSITDLMSAFAKALKQATVSIYEVTAEPWTVEMKVQELRTLLMVKRQLQFGELFTTEQSTLELVVTFLALLELMRQRVVRAIQERHFADILIALLEPAAALGSTPT